MLKRRTEADEIISEINVTPFVDVLLVLLVIFMITAPLFTKAIDVNLPKEKIDSSPLVEARKWVVSIDKKGRYHLNGKRLKLDDLIKKTLLWQKQNPDKTAFVRGDEKVAYGKVTRLMSHLKNAGVQRLGLLVEDQK